MSEREQEAYLGKRLQEIARRARETGTVQYSRFLSPAESDSALRAAREAGANVAFFGGYDDAERRLAAFSEDTLTEMPADAPLAWLSVHWHPRYGSPGHRDLMGAALSLGLDRDIFGDIIAREQIAYMVVWQEMADFVCTNLVKAGEMELAVTRIAGRPEMPQPVYRMRHDTVASLRLDAVLAAAFHLSRQQAADMITSGMCKVEHRYVQEPDFMLTQGMLLSLRGKGRVRLGEIGGVNRKGRTGITLLYNEN